MCQSLQTAAGQQNIPDFLKYGFGQGRLDNAPSKSGDPVVRGVDVPLNDADDARRISLERRRREIQEAQKQSNPSSHIPTGIRGRKALMDELT